MFSKIKNGIMSSKRQVKVCNSSFNRMILKVLLEEGYINAYDVADCNREIIVSIKYDNKGVPVIRFLSRVSKLSRRVYTKSQNIKNLKRVNKFSTLILSTNMGVMADVDALKHNVGGEVICEVSA